MDACSSRGLQVYGPPCAVDPGWGGILCDVQTVSTGGAAGSEVADRGPLRVDAAARHQRISSLRGAGTNDNRRACFGYLLRGYFCGSNALGTPKRVG
jgi:hypothetical protein